MSAPTSDRHPPTDLTSFPQEDAHQRVIFLRRLVGGLFACILIGLLSYMLAPNWFGYMLYRPRAGDVLFQSLPDSALPESAMARAIEGATHSPFSHCGILAYENANWFVYEALNTVQRTPLRAWIARGRGQAFSVYRIPDAERSFLPRTLDYVRQALGRPHDDVFNLEDDSAFYSSELIYRAFKSASAHELVEAVRLGDLDWQPYREVFEKLGDGTVPVDRRIIPPRLLSESLELQEAYRYGFPAPPPRPKKEPAPNNPSESNPSESNPSAK